MKRFVKAAAMTAASCAVVLSGAGVASASDHGRHHNHNRHYHDHYRNDHRGLYNHRSGANAAGFAAGSPGILSGNNVQVPINIPINICGNSLNLLAALNPAFGNACVNR
ncbi:chaplin [Streptomyces decoyicus]|uniref:chaplin n=1 Tax=Streptomyces decoyicus TaxID=249567 RepID=UPI00345DE946